VGAKWRPGNWPSRRQLLLEGAVVAIVALAGAELIPLSREERLTREWSTAQQALGQDIRSIRQMRRQGSGQGWRKPWTTGWSPSLPVIS